MILQMGTGAFLRGFLGWMLREARYDGRVVVSGLTRGGSAAALRAQGLRFSHTIRGLSGGATVDTTLTNEVIGEALDPYADFERLKDVARDPALRLVVTNATEAGMAWAAASAPSPCPDPSSAKLAALLVARFHALGDAAPPLLVAPTELVEGNGRRLRELVRRHADEWGTDESFGPWLDGTTRFVDTLVDRIVAKAPTADDPLAISSEPYHLWALADEGALGEVFDTRDLNVVSAPDLAPWRERKVRLLNGGHACLVFTGLLGGLVHVADAMNDDVHRAFLERCLREEVLPTLAGDGLEAYLGDVLERFANPFLDHRLDAIRLNSHAKVHVRLLPAMRDHAARTGALPKGLVTALAAFLVLYRDAEGGDDGEVLARYRGRSPSEALADPVLFSPDSLAGLEDLPAAADEAAARLERDVSAALA